MGNYNSQYESYYSKFTGNKRNNNPYSNYLYRNNASSSNKVSGNYFTRRLLRELIGVFCLLFLVLVCKVIVTPQTQAVYNYSKNIVDNNYDYTYLIETVKSINISDMKNINEKVQDSIEALKVKITGGQTIKDQVKENFIYPIDGEITSAYGERNDPITGEKSYHEGVDINAPEGSNVKAAFDGSIKESGENETLGKYILVNHGSGIESRYAHLSSILVEQSNNIKKGEVIGKSGNTGKSTAPHLHFELLYMGQSKNPVEYINFGAK